MLSIVVMLLFGLQAPGAPVPEESVATNVDGREQILAEARVALAGAQTAGDPHSARVLVNRAVALIAPLPVGEGREEVADLLFEAGLVASTTGSVEAALVAWTRFVEHVEATRPADHRDIVAGRGNLASALVASGDLSGARALQQAVLESCERTQPEDDASIQLARLHLAATLKTMGDVPGARALEELVVAARERTLPPEHPMLLAARVNLAASMKVMGDLAGARAIEEDALARVRELFPPEHPDRVAVQVNLATTLSELGDHVRARALLESAVEQLERVRHPDDPGLLLARQNLAGTMMALGDSAGALAVLEDVLARYQRQLPPQHPAVLTLRANLASAMQRTGNLEAARALQEAGLDAFERMLPPEDRRLLGARQNLAGTLARLGDHEAARALEEELLETYLRLRPEDHPDVLRTRHNLAVALRSLGDLDGARSELEKVLAARERALPVGHPRLLGTRQILAITLRQAGDLEASRSQRLALATGMLRRLELVSALSPREAREAADREGPRHEAVRFLTQGSGAEELRFEVTETLRAVSMASSGAALGDATRRWRLASLRARLGDLVGGVGRESPPEALSVEVSRLTLERDRVEREIRAELAESGAVAGPVRAVDVAAALPEGAVAVGFVRYRKWTFDPESASIEDPGFIMAAHVLHADGGLVEIELGAAREIQGLARGWRAALGAPVRGRSVGVSGASASDDGELAAGRALRARVFDPLLDALGDARVLFVCPDDFLFTVPLEALPLEGESDERVGDRRMFVHEASFVPLLASRPDLALQPEETQALFVGAVAYDEEAAAVSVSFSAPVDDARSGAPARFVPLAGTGREVGVAATTFREVFEREGVVLSGGDASKASLHRLAPGKRFLHIATHGWFAPEAVPSRRDESTEDGMLGIRRGARETVAGLAPMTLCGLAFAGANHGRDALGRVPGILTAEELSGLDLSACELAVLSACETNVGISRAGQGIQSLQTALHAAGARTAITSLWKVDDAATRKLMERFYTYLWVDELGKADALWKAKCDLREEGHPVRDWAAWVLSGDPE